MPKIWHSYYQRIQRSHRGVPSQYIFVILNILTPPYKHYKLYLIYSLYTFITPLQTLQMVDARNHRKNLKTLNQMVIEIGSLTLPVTKKKIIPCGYSI